MGITWRKHKKKKNWVTGEVVGAEKYRSYDILKNGKVVGTAETMKDAEKLMDELEK